MSNNRPNEHSTIYRSIVKDSKTHGHLTKQTKNAK